MPEASQKVLWRDRFVLSAFWVLLLFAAFAEWSIATSAQAASALSASGFWPRLFGLYGYWILPPLVLTLPLALLILRRVNPSLFPSGLVRGLQHPNAIWLMVFSFGVGQLSLFSKELRENGLVEFFFIWLVGLFVVSQFYRRTTMDIRKTVTAVTLGAGMVTIRQTLLLLPGKVDFLTASWYTQAYLVLHILFFVALLSTPLLLLSQRLQRVLRGIRAHWADSRSSFLLPVVFVLASLWSLGFGRVLADGFGGVLATRLAFPVLILAAGGILIRAYSGERLSKLNGSLAIGNRGYVAFLGFLLAVYALFAVRVGMNRLDAINPDGLAYLIIARKYASGTPVIRGYWSPLISWLIAPLISGGMDPHAGFLFAIGLSGLVWVLLSVLLAERAGVGRPGLLAVAASMITIALSRGLHLVTPDLLGAVFVALYFFWITHPDYERDPVRYGVLTGLSGALAYYGKYYNLAFVLVHLVVTAALRFTHKRGIRPLVIGTVVSMLVIGACTAPWAFALYTRYGRLTMTTSLAITRASVGPGFRSHPCWEDRLCAQPEDVLIPWEDPQPQYYPTYGWSPFDNGESFRYQIRLIRENTWKWALDTLFTLGPLLPLALLAVGFGMMSHWTDIERRLRHSWVFLSLMLYASGYLLTFLADFRYYLAALPLLVISGQWSLQRVLKRLKARHFIQGETCFRSFTALVLILSVLSLGQSDRILSLLTEAEPPCAKSLTEAIAPSLIEPIAGMDRRVNHVAYYSNERTLGVLPSRITAEEADHLLRETGVETLVALSETELTSALLGIYNYPVVSEADVCGTHYLVLRVPGDEAFLGEE